MKALLIKWYVFALTVIAAMAAVGYIRPIFGQDTYDAAPIFV